MQIILLVLVLLILAAGVFLAIGARKTRTMADEARATVPQAGQIIEVPGGAVHLLDMGPRDAPAVVMIHGLGGQMHHFTYAMTDLLKDDFRLIVLDRPGCGYSRRDTEAQAELTAQGRMIWAALEHLDVRDPVLVGHSLGGAVALGMAVDRPDQAKALALIAPLTRPDVSPSDAFAGLNVPNRTARRLLAHTWAVPMARAGALNTLNMVFAPEPWPADFLERGGGALGLRPESFLASVEDYMASDGIGAISQDYGARLKTPGGILYGADDALLDPVAQGQSMEEFGLEYKALPGRGHMLPITAPAECATFVRKMAARQA